MKRKGLFVIIYSDQDEAYVFGTKKEAQKVLKDDLRDHSENGVKGEIYNLTKTKPTITYTKIIEVKQK